MLNRRQFLIGAASTAGAAFLSACGDDSDNDAITDDTADAAFPVTVEHTFGSTEVPERPTRIAAIDVYEADVVLALGLAPVAINFYNGFPDGIAAWQLPLLADPPPVAIRYVDGYDIEGTAATEPDLILGSFVDDAAYELLSEVAPTVILDYETDLRDRVKKIGAATGEPEKADEVLAAYEATIAEATAALGLEGKTVAAAAYYDTGVISNVSDVDSFEVFAELGAIPAPTFDDIEAYAELSLERIDLLDGHLLYVTYGSEALQAELEANPLFQALPAVVEGRYLGVLADGELDLTRARGVLQVPHALKGVVPEVQALDL